MPGTGEGPPYTRTYTNSLQVNLNIHTISQVWIVCIKQTNKLTSLIKHLTNSPSTVHNLWLVLEQGLSFTMMTDDATFWCWYDQQANRFASNSTRSTAWFHSYYSSNVLVGTTYGTTLASFLGVQATMEFDWPRHVLSKQWSELTHHRTMFTLAQ